MPLDVARSRSMPLADARKLAQTLPTDQQKLLLDKVAAADQAGNTTVDVGWVKSTGDVGAAADRMRQDGFQAAGPAPTTTPRPPAVRPEVTEWLNYAFGDATRQPAAEIKKQIGIGEAKLQLPNLSNLEEGRIHLALSGLHVRLADKGEDQLGNGKASFKELKRAVEKAPSDVDVATSYGQTMDALARLSTLKRFGVEAGLGISIKDEGKAALALLRHQTGDARAQVVRERLADALKNQGEAQAARQALALLPRDQVDAQRQSANQTASQANSAAAKQ